MSAPRFGDPDDEEEAVAPREARCPHLVANTDVAMAKVPTVVDFATRRGECCTPRSYTVARHGRRWLQPGTFACTTVARLTTRAVKTRRA